MSTARPQTSGESNDPIYRLVHWLDENTLYLSTASATYTQLAALSGALARLQATIDARLGRRPAQPWADAPVEDDEAPAGFRFDRVLRGLVIFHVRGLRSVLNLALRATFLVFLFLFFWQLPHPAHWNAWVWVAALQGLGSQVLLPIDSLLGWPAAKPFYPFAIALVASIANISLDYRLQSILKKLQKTPRVQRLPAPVRMTSAVPVSRS